MMFKKTPSVSVLMPAFNAGQYLKLAVESILNQTYADFELIIVDDGSTDGSFDSLSEIKDDRIVIVRNENNRGLIAARNLALQTARAPLLACLDADDVALPNRLEKQVEVFSIRPDLAVLGSRAYLVDEWGTPFDVADVPTDTAEIRRDFLRVNKIIHSSVMMRAGTVKALGGYPLEYPLAEDYALWARAIGDHEIMNLPDRLVQYRVHGAQISQRKLAYMRQMAEKVQVDAWGRLQRTGKTDGILAPLAPTPWFRLRGMVGSLGGDYWYWARLYRKMGCWPASLKLSVRGILNAPLCFKFYLNLVLLIRFAWRSGTGVAEQMPSIDNE